MSREEIVNPFAPPALAANDGLSLEEGLSFELTQNDVTQAADRCAMQMHSVFSVKTFAVALILVLILAVSLPSRYFFVYWLGTLVAAFFIQKWFSDPVRKRILRNATSEQSLAPGQKRIVLREGVLGVTFNGKEKQFPLSEIQIRSEGYPTTGNRTGNMSSIVLEVSKDHILVVPGHAFPAAESYRDNLKLLKRAMRDAKRAAALANDADR